MISAQRQKWTVDRIIDALERRNLDPFDELARLAQYAESEKIRVQCLKELAEYLVSKKRQIEVEDDIKEAISVLKETMQAVLESTKQPY